MVVADGSGGPKFLLPNEVWILCPKGHDLKEYNNDVTHWLTENLGPAYQNEWAFSPYSSSFSSEKIVRFLKYDDVWTFMEWLEEYEEDRSLYSN